MKEPLKLTGNSKAMSESGERSRKNPAESLESIQNPTNRSILRKNP